MRTGYLKTILLLVLLVVISPIVALAQQEDVAGSKDHPMIKRYPGSIITGYNMMEFDEKQIPLGPFKAGKFEKIQATEGKVTSIIYTGPGNRSVLEVFRNYEMALNAAGFQTLFTCVNEACGYAPYGFEVPGFLAWGHYPGHRHLSAKLSRPEGDVYVSLHVSSLQYSSQGPTMSLVVVEAKPMEAGLVTVDAAAMAGDIARTGHVAIYGIYFDFDKADVKPESEPALQEIAKLLQQDPNLKLHVVGHTDNVGDLAYNMDLSRRRAQAVVQELTTKYSIVPARLQADGVGPLSPVATNDTEEGRAKNRRVELVKQ